VRERVLSVPEAAEVLGLSIPSVYWYCREGRLGRKVGGRYEIGLGELRRFAAKPRVPGWPRGKKRRKSGSVAGG